MKIFISFLFLFTLVFSSHSQRNTPFEKEYFKSRPAQYREAAKILKEGYSFYEVIEEKYIDNGSQEAYERANYYQQALPYLQQANKFNSNNAELNYRLGHCLLVSPNKKISLKYFQQAFKLDNQVSKYLYYYLGVSHQLNENFDDAIGSFKKFIKVSAVRDENSLADARKRIKECEVGKKLAKEPVRVFIDNVGKNINTKYPEYGAIISTDEAVIIFTSRRETSTGADRLDSSEGYREDIYFSNKSERGRWGLSKNIGSPINTIEHDATVAVSPDGQNLIIYKDDNGDGNLYECKLKGDIWSKPERMNSNINSKYHESSASYSSDGKTLFFVSNRPGGVGGHDIYFSQWGSRSAEWLPAENIGNTINTPYNEESVLIHPDGNTLYFSSKGHETMGGFDIFVAEKNEHHVWQPPKNIGYPINTVDDDVFFVLNGSGRRGYYSSVRKEGYGEKDIYVITFLGPEKPFQLSAQDNLLASIAKPINEKIIEKSVEVSSKKLTLLKGIVKDEATHQPLGAEITLVDLDKGEVLAVFESNIKTGSYLVTLPSGKNYGIITRKEGYLFNSLNFNIPSSAAFREVVKDVELKKFAVGNRIVLNNIFYDYNKSSLRNVSKSELNILGKLLKEHPKLKVEVSAHTDSRGSNNYNLKLSEERAASCVSYLISKGVSRSQMVTKGYGESRLINSDAKINRLPESMKEEAHQENRRSEIKILAF